MDKEKAEFDWKQLPGELEAKGKDLLKAGLGIIDALEEQTGKLAEVVKRDRADIIADLQKKGTDTVESLQKQANEIFDDLVDRGDKMQKSGTERAGEAMTALATRQRNLADRIEAAASQIVAGALKRVDVPTSREVHDLTDRVEKLTSEVERLAALLSSQEDHSETRPVFEVAAEGEGWVLRDVGKGEVIERFETKAGAVKKGREVANAAAPSALQVLKMDGTVQDTAHYE